MLTDAADKRAKLSADVKAMSRLVGQLLLTAGAAGDPGTRPRRRMMDRRLSCARPASSAWPAPRRGRSIWPRRCRRGKRRHDLRGNEGRP